jgi:hypothetical protein
MSKKEIQVTCPCCETQLLVDVRTEQVLRQRQPGREETSWADAHARVEGRSERATDAFDAALGGEQQRSRDLDDLFAEARKKAEEREQRDL